MPVAFLCVFSLKKNIYISYCALTSNLLWPTVSRLASMDLAIHKLNVGHYTLDVKVSQFMDRLSRMDGKTGDGVDETESRGINAVPRELLFSI